MSTHIVHDTLHFERTFSRPPSVVFAAYADVDQRVVWSAPSDDEIVIFESHDFTVGGVDTFICGLKESPSFAGTTRYEHIVDDEAIVFTDPILLGRIVRNRASAVSAVDGKTPGKRAMRSSKSSANGAWVSTHLATSFSNASYEHIVKPHRVTSISTMEKARVCASKRFSSSSCQTAMASCWIWQLCIRTGSVRPCVGENIWISSGIVRNGRFGWSS